MTTDRDDLKARLDELEDDADVGDVTLEDLVFGFETDEEPDDNAVVFDFENVDT